MSMWNINISSDDLIAVALNHLAERINDWREAWPEVNRRFEQLERDLFASGGATGAHGPWAEDKRLRGQLGESHPPLIRTGALENSLTQRGAEYAILEMNPTEFVRGTSRRGARFQVERRGNRPARRPIDLTDEQIHKDLLSPLNDEAKKRGQSEGFIVTDE